MIRIFFGVVMVLAGFFGLFLPFLQGLAMIILGVYLIAPEKGRRIVSRGKELFNKKFGRGKNR